VKQNIYSRVYLSKKKTEYIWQGFRWAWNTDDKLLSIVDASITKAFKQLNYSTRTSDEYLSLLGSSYPDKPDMSHAFFGTNGSFVICFKCIKENRGLHIHMIPNNQQAHRDVEQVEHNVGNPALKVASLKDTISDLTWDNKLTILSAILALLGIIVNMTLQLALSGSLLLLVQATFTIATLLSIGYLIAVLLLMIQRAYFASKLVRRF